MSGYFTSKNKRDCVACGACAQVCPCAAITMEFDEYGFLYPVIDYEKCISCNRCVEVCLFEEDLHKHEGPLYSYGGYIKDRKIRENSTSGGAFTAICSAFCDGCDPYAVFGSASDKMRIYHTYVNKIDDIFIFNSSKYGQSVMGDSFRHAKSFLKEKKRVVFSGTPCQIAALYRFLGEEEFPDLLTVEVLCTGIPSSLFVEKYDEWCFHKYGSHIQVFNYRYTNHNRWDDQSTLVELDNGKKIVTARWFSNFYSIFLQRLMSRPSCNECKFVTKGRVADITLSDLWGVDRECPDLYEDGSGSSWIICNTQKGLETLERAKQIMTGHEVDFEQMRKYQRPGLIQKTVHPSYDEFMEDIKTMDYKALCRKWAKKPSLRLLFQKYIYNNRMRVRIWKMFSA